MRNIITGNLNAANGRLKLLLHSRSGIFVVTKIRRHCNTVTDKIIKPLVINDNNIQSSDPRGTYLNVLPFFDPSPSKIIIKASINVFNIQGVQKNIKHPGIVAAPCSPKLPQVSGAFSCIIIYSI